jgi:hypothetical protein
MEVVQIVESRTKVLLLLVVALAFVVGYAFLPDPNHELPSWGGWFFGLCAAVFVVLLFRPRRITLDDKGFSVSGGLARRSRRIAWDDVTGFFPLSVGVVSKMVAYNYSVGARNKPRGAWLTGRLSGADAAIGGAWTCSTTELADQLNSYRERVMARR